MYRLTPIARLIGVSAFISLLPLFVYATPSPRPATTIVSSNPVDTQPCLLAPIGLARDTFDVPQFGTVKGDNMYSDGTFTSLPMRRMFLRDDPTANDNANSLTHVPGQFAWLRWLDNNGDLNFADAMTAALTPPGTADNYEEAPRNNPFPAEPATYPDSPGVPSAWDIMYGTQTMSLGDGYGTGTGFNGQQPSNDEQAVLNQIQWHIQNHTRMNLPEYDLTSNGIRQIARYRIRGFGSYLIAGYGYIAQNDPWLKDPNGAQDLTRGYGWFIDLVKLSSTYQCGTTPTSSVTLQGTSKIKPVHSDIQATTAITLAGSIKIQPQYATVPSYKKPLDLVFVLDGSNSMNWTWDGLGTLSAGLYQELQANGTLPPGAQVGGDIDCVALLVLPTGCTSADAYHDYTQRRIYQAKQGIASFIEQYPWYEGSDRATVVSFSGGWPDPTGNDPAMLAQVYPPEGFTTNIVSGTDSLHDLLLNQAASANPGNTDPDALYTTAGGSPGAIGLQRVKQLLDSQARPDAERSVVMLTDGLFNVYLNGGLNANKSIAANYDPTWTQLLPINEAGTQANLIKDQNNALHATLFVLALGNTFSQSGLDYFASSKSAPFFNTVNSADAIQSLLNVIGTDIIYGECDPYSLQPQVPPAERMFRLQGSSYVPATDVNGQPTLGTVTVRDANGGPVTRVDIHENGVFTITNLLPNTTYRLSFNRPADDPIFYLGDDGAYRNYSLISVTGTDTLEVRTSETSLGPAQYVLDGTPVLLLLNGTLCLEGGGPPAPFAPQATPTARIANEMSAVSLRAPVDIALVLDASGSMNWTWDGRGTMSATLYNDLQNQGQLPPGAQIGGDVDCVALLVLPKGCQSADAYQDYTQRRLYIVKQGLKTFLESFPWHAGDRAALVTYNGSGGGTIAKIYPTSGLTETILGGTGSLVDLLINQAASKSPGSSDPAALYTTLGGSPGALGLQNAHEALQSAPSEANRRQVVLFMADGLLNVDMNGVSVASETLETTYDPSWQHPEFPINQAISQGQLLSHVSSIAIGTRFNPIWLPEISSPDARALPYVADSPATFPALLNQFGNYVNTLIDCDLMQGDAKVPEWERSAWGVRQTPPTLDGEPIVGTVVARNSSGAIVASTGVLTDGSWSLSGLEPATTYTLSFNSSYTNPLTQQEIQQIVYKGDDGFYRNYSIVESTGSDQLVIETAPEVGIQTLSEPVVLLYALGCPPGIIIATVTPTGSATPTDATTETPTEATATETATPTMTATRTATPTATSKTPTATQTPTVSPTNGPPRNDADSEKVYLPLVRR